MRSVDENTPAGVNIGAPVAASDDDNDTLTYSLDDTGRATFDIVATTGQLQTKAASGLRNWDQQLHRGSSPSADPFGLNDTIDGHHRRQQRR